MKIIGHIKTDFKEKFGIPRQSGLIDEVKGEIVFEKEFRIAEAFRGIEEFSHIWVLWQFSETADCEWSPTVRPPLLGGNKRVGVFATRSPFRPNSMGLSCVRLERIEFRKNEGPVLCISGVDMLDGTPVYDIKPYLPYADSKPDAVGGFTENIGERKIDVRIETEDFFDLSEEKQLEIIKILENDPRPSYKTEERLYGMKYSDWEIGFAYKQGMLVIKSIRKRIVEKDYE
ncbi:MAG: tRNA (N6-threonylcarbamoyladenosine(37)-N6)-methyltransferase TrmO [Clostridia bacterium]|nr:tRNA (N6-threonylcarbamoyladenosine(37)-N6)-methyltransferase TrmO [Clostridia bacterium]